MVSVCVVSGVCVCGEWCLCKMCALSECVKCVW